MEVLTINAQGVALGGREDAVDKHVVAGNGNTLGATTTPHLLSALGLGVAPGVAGTGIEEDRHHIQVNQDRGLLDRVRREGRVGLERRDTIDRCRGGGAEVVGTAVSWLSASLAYLSADN